MSEVCSNNVDSVIIKTFEIANCIKPHDGSSSLVLMLNSVPLRKIVKKLVMRLLMDDSCTRSQLASFNEMDSFMMLSCPSIPANISQDFKELISDFVVEQAIAIRLGMIEKMFS